MKKSFKKSIAVLLAVLMIVCTMPMTVFASSRANIDLQFGVLSAGTDRQTYVGSGRKSFDATKTGLAAAKLDYDKTAGTLTDSTNSHKYAVGDFFTVSVLLENVSSLASAQIALKYSDTIAPAAVESNTAKLASELTSSPADFPVNQAVPAQSGDAIYNKTKSDAAVGEFSYIDADNSTMWATYAVQTGDNSVSTATTKVGTNTFSNTAVVATFAFKVVKDGAITFSLADDEDVYSAYYLPQLSDDNSPSKYMTYAKTAENGSATLDFMGTNKNVESKKYTIKFVGADGKEISSTEYAEGATVKVPDLPTPTKKDDDTHYVYSWNTTPALTATANATYTVVATAEAHKWDAGVKQDDGSTLYTCDVCGTTKTEKAEHTHNYVWTYNNDAVYDKKNYVDGTATGVCEDCGDTITKTIPGTGLLKANSATVTLGAAVVLNMGIDVSRQKAFKEVYFNVKFAGKDYPVTEVNDTKSTTSRTFFDFDKISPDKFGDDVIITPVGVTEDGIVCKGHDITYSIKQYCMSTLGKSASSAKLKTLLVEILYYGEAYQQYRNYKTNQLVTADLTAAQKALHSTDVPEYTKSTNPNYETNPNGTAANEVTFKSATMLLEGKVIPKISFTIPVSADISDYTFTWIINGKETNFTYTEHPEWFTRKSATSKEVTYQVECQVFKANQFSIPFYLTVSKNGKQVSNKLAYSVESYAFSSAYSKDAKLKNLVDQILRYGRADVAQMGGTN